MAEPATKIGDNRTGIQSSKSEIPRLREISSKAPARDAEELSLTTMRQAYAREMGSLGSVPPPASIKGMATTTLEKIQGHKPSVFIDKLGERLAFERSGVRIYESMLIKFDALDTWEGGPTRDLLKHHLKEELSHFKLMMETLERLGADPTAMTPSADIAAVENEGLMNVIVDPRTTMPQALHAILCIEDSDVEGWNMLIKLADNIGQSKLADRFREAEQTEQTHLARAREWLSTAVLADAQRELGTQGTATSQGGL